jgi:hypothetical protein
MRQTYEDKFPFDAFSRSVWCDYILLLLLLLLLHVTEHQVQFRTSTFALAKNSLAECQCSALCLILLLRSVHYTKKIELSRKDQFDRTFWCIATKKSRRNVYVCSN